MTRPVSLLFALAVLSTATVQAQSAPKSYQQPYQTLVYGQSYSLQSLYNANSSGGYYGGYLDANGTGCQGDALCVSTSMTANRSGSSGTWVILSASGKAVGATVDIGDNVYLENLSTGSPTYLETNGNGCQGDDFCVAASTSKSRDGKSGTWKIHASASGTTGPAYPGMDLHLENLYGSGGDYLDADGTGCQGNAYCVATSPGWDRSDNSTHWTFQPASSSTAATGWCLSSSSAAGLGINTPVVILDNGITQLTWDAYGDLNLVNYGAVGLTSAGILASESVHTWGIQGNVQSPAVPVMLTGSNAATLCFQTNGILTITAAGGAVAWQSDTVSATNATLSLNQCTASISGNSNGSLTTPWTVSTADCNARQISSPPMPSAVGYGNGWAITQASGSQNLCWPASANNQRILWDTSTNQELDWQSGTLSVVDNSLNYTVWKSAYIMGSNTQMGYNPAQAAMLCYQSDGNLVVYKNITGLASAALWASGSNGDPFGNALTLDPCGFGFTGNSSPNIQTAREDDWLGYLSKTSYEPFCTMPRTEAAWCYGSNAPATILTEPAVGGRSAGLGDLVLMWTGSSLWFGYAANYENQSLWQSPAGSYVCNQSDGNLVVYKSNGSPVWSTATYGEPTANTLSIEGQTLEMTIPSHVALCNGLEACLNANSGNLSACTGSGTDGGADGGAGYTSQEQAECGTNSFFTPWTMNVTPGLTQFAQGGFSFIKDEKAGNSRFGVETWLVGAAADANSLNVLQTQLNGAPADQALQLAGATSTVPADFAMSMSSAGVNATLFGDTVTVVALDGFAEGQNGAGYMGLGAIILGQLTTEVGADSANITASIAAQKDFFTAQTTLGEVPILVFGSVTGSVGINFSGTVDQYQFTVTAEPIVSLDVLLSVGVGETADCSAGIQGDLTLISLGFPFTTAFNYGGGQSPSYNESAQFQETVLSGALNLYAQCGPFSITQQLCGWNGGQANVNLFSVNGPL